MSSAILYVAIVAIWAGVLIPRWLRRDSAASVRCEENLVPRDAESEEVPAARRRRRDEAIPAAHVVPSVPRDEEHKKVLTARRRLLGMLLALVTGSAALAYTRMAAWWVIVPPTVMLLGYLILLREASKADAERREQARARATAAAAVAAARRAAAPPVPAAPVPAPDAEVIDISATLIPAGQEFYDQYADAKLRAVGDLTRVLAG